MSFQGGIGSLGEAVLFQMGLCNPLQTMCTNQEKNLITTELDNYWNIFGCNVFNPKTAEGGQYDHPPTAR